ncbi:MAG: DUF1269 domain-containing protein [Chloroflexi bacterium]|nr:DUF1269 domain-containing protein [Chloroflexota bacterium]
MSSESPLQLIVAAFQKEDAADAALNAIIQARKERRVKIHEAAVVRRDTGGKLHIHERGDLGPGAGAASGAALGAAVGLFGGPLGALLGGAAGAAIGGIAARLIDTGIPDDRLRQIGAALQPGTSAIVAMIEHTWVGEIQDELQRAGGNLLAAAISEDVKNQLAAGKDVAYSAVTMAGGTVAGRVSAGQEGVTVQGLATDGQNLVAGAFTAVTDAASEAAKTAQDVASEATEAVTDAASEAAKTAQDVASEATEAVTDAASEAAKTAQDVASEATEAVTDATRKQ